MDPTTASFAPALVGDSIGDPIANPVEALVYAVVAEPGAEVNGPLASVDKDQLFRSLVAQHRVRLQRFVLRHIGHPDDAEDIAQHAFLEAARTIDKFRGQSELSTWLYGIAMNLVRNYCSRAPHRVRAFEGDDQLIDMPSSPHDDPQDQVSRRQLMHKLASSMNELPMCMREVLLLVAVDELPYEEAATILSVPIGTVRSRLSRARSMLRSRFSDVELELSP